MHALSLGHPVMGDSLYGTEGGKALSDRLLLHATRLSFPHVSCRLKLHNPLGMLANGRASDGRARR